MMIKIVLSNINKCFTLCKAYIFLKKCKKAPHDWTKVQYFTLCKASTFSLQNVVHP